MMSKKLIPEVHSVAEFREICMDFSDPREIVREAISNAIDAKAKTITIAARKNNTTGVELLEVILKDDGEGMSEKDLSHFFDLGNSSRYQVDEYNLQKEGHIGEKGHGTKIYFNSKRITVTSLQNKKKIVAMMEAPIATLRTGKLPEVKYDVTDSKEEGSFTEIKVLGYALNNYSDFNHPNLKDYIYWATKFASPEGEIGIEDNKALKIELKGIDKEVKFETLDFGHPFPAEETELTELKKKTKDGVDPLDYYVAKWVFKQEKIDSLRTIDVVFYLEGNEAKSYNPMIKQKHVHDVHGLYRYAVTERYGLWLCKDFIPIERRNEWVATKSEWTKYHAFVNCQGFKLTANRGSLGNTPSELVTAVQKKVESLFRNEIKKDKKYKQFEEYLKKIETERTVEKEKKSFNKKKELASKKATCLVEYRVSLPAGSEPQRIEHTFYEPRQEGEVLVLLSQLLVLKKDLFDFEIVDYDTNSGYDLLVRVNERDVENLNDAKLRFVELKYKFRKYFNHSFKNLHSIICWEVKAASGDEVRDLSGVRREFAISRGGEYKQYFLQPQGEGYSIEVVALKDYLKAKMGLEWRK